MVTAIPNASDVHALVKEKKVEEKGNTALVKLQVISADNFSKNFLMDQFRTCQKRTQTMEIIVK
jgi:hypothetical protein